MRDQSLEKAFGNWAAANVTGADEENTFHDARRVMASQSKLESEAGKSTTRRLAKKLKLIPPLGGISSFLVMRRGMAQHRKCQLFSSARASSSAPLMRCAAPLELVRKIGRAKPALRDAALSTSVKVN